MSRTLSKVRSMVTERVSGTDGKSYRAKKLTEDQRRYLVWQVHELRHTQGLSERGIQAALENLGGVRLSAGTIHGYLNHYYCSRCYKVQEG